MAKAATPEKTGAALVKAGEARYASVVKEFQGRFTKLSKGVLQIYWDIGIHLTSLTDKPGYFGSHTVGDIGRDLNLSGETLRAAMRFNRAYTKVQLAGLQSRRISWHNTIILLAVDNVEKRTEMETDLASGKLKSKDLPEMVKKITTAEREANPDKSRRGGSPPTTVLRQASKLSSSLGDFLGGEVTQALKAFEKMDAEKSEKAAEYRKDLKRGLTVLARKVSGALSYFD